MILEVSIMANSIIAPVKGLTDVFISNLKPRDTRYEVSDLKCSGLRIRVGTSGKKTFIWMYKDSARNPKRLTLGAYPALSLSSARKALERAKIKHSAGELHSTLTSAPKTVKELCRLFYTDRIEKQRRRPEAVLQVIEHDIIPAIGNKALNNLSVIAVSSVISAVVNRGAVVHAGKVTAILKQLFKFAEGRGFIDRSPAYALDKKDLGVITNTRDRWLTVDELEPVWKAIVNAPRLSLPTKNGLLILLLSGMRTGELLQAEWKNINFVTREWLIPKADTKTLQEWTIPITDGVVRLLNELQGLDPVFVFPGKNGKLGDKVLGRAVKRLFDKGELTIEPFSPHDFRRTIRTHLEQLNVDAHIAEKCLNHSLGSINATYNKNSYLAERREALERWEQFVLLQVNPQKNIINFQRVG